MPNAPKTPQRALRIPDDEWNDLGTIADATGTDRTAIVRELVQWYLRRPGVKTPKRPEATGIDRPETAEERLIRENCEHDTEPYPDHWPEIRCRKCGVIVGPDGPRFEKEA